MSETEIPEDLRYSAEDEWARAEDGRIRIGITDYAQQSLGDIVFVDLPAVGARVTAGESFGVIESVKAVSDLYAPVSGEVAEINSALEEKPEIVNEGCYGDGWICVVTPADPAEVDGLMDAAAYRKHVDDRSE